MDPRGRFTKPEYKLSSQLIVHPGLTTQNKILKLQRKAQQLSGKNFLNS